MEESIEKRLREIVNKISKLKYVSAIFLFGSQINGMARADSDIDLAVLIDKPTRDKELKIIGYGDDTFDISALNRLPLVIQFRIFKEGKILFKKNNEVIVNQKIETFKRYLDFSVFLNKFYRRVLHV